jgi:hypothetical protein
MERAECCKNRCGMREVFVCCFPSDHCVFIYFYVVITITIIIIIVIIMLGNADGFVTLSALVFELLF